MFGRFYRTLKDYKDLVLQLTISDLKTNTARTYLGFFWWIFDPILYMLVFYLLIEVILNRGGPNYSVFLFTALIPLKWTISCLVDSTNEIASKSSIISQIFVPKVVFILVRFIINTLKFSISCIVLFIFLLLYGIDITLLILYFPLILIVHGLFLFSIMLILAHIGIFIRDMKNLLQYFTRFLFYLSPVMFSLETVPEQLVKYLYLNPLTTLIESYRNVLMYGKEPQFIGLAIIFIIGIVMLKLGLSIVFKYDKKYVKVI